LKFSDLVVDINYFSFSQTNPNPNLTHLPKHEFLSPNKSVLSIFGLQNITLCMCTWCGVRNFAWHRIWIFHEKPESFIEHFL